MANLFLLACRGETDYNCIWGGYNLLVPRPSEEQQLEEVKWL